MTYREACRQAVTERDERFRPITPENADDAIRFQARRVRELTTNRGEMALQALHLRALTKG